VRSLIIRYFWLVLLLGLSKTMDNLGLIDDKLVELVRQGNKLFFYPDCDTDCQWIFDPSAIGRYWDKSYYFVVLSPSKVLFLTKDDQDRFWQKLSDNLNRLGDKELGQFNRLLAIT